MGAGVRLARLVVALAMGLVAALGVTALTSATASAVPCRNCGGGDGGGGSGGSTDSAHYAMYLIGFSQLDNRVLQDKDQIATTVTNGTPGYVQLQLHAADNVRWWKEIKVFGSSAWALGQDYTQDNKKDTVTLMFRTDQLQGAALVFSKAKAFGVHTGVYEVHNLQSQDGKKLTFDWRRDG